MPDLSPTVFWLIIVPILCGLPVLVMRAGAYYHELRRRYYARKLDHARRLDS